MRDKIKDKKYFDDCITRMVHIFNEEKEEYRRNKKEKGEDYGGAANIIGMYSSMNIYLYCAYSRGDSIESLIKPYRQLLHYFILSWNKKYDYSDGGDIPYNLLLFIVSLGALLPDNFDELKLLSDIMIQTKYGDYIIDCILKYKVSSHIITDKILVSENIVSVTLKNAIQQPIEKSEQLLKNFLENDWYTEENLEDLYNSHTSDNYIGYWSIESAAITLIHGLDDSSFRNSQYYPKDLADAAKQQGGNVSKGNGTNKWNIFDNL